MLKKNAYKILSFDPGSIFMGWASSIYTLDNDKFHNKRRGTILGEKYKTALKDRTAIYPKRQVKLEYIESEVRKLMKIKPDFVAVEAAYMNPRCPNAYAPLILVTQVIWNVVKCELGKPIEMISATHAKNVVTSHGGANKTTVQDAIIRHEDIILDETKQQPISKMSEHEADAIAIGYTFAKDILITKWMQSSIER